MVQIKGSVQDSVWTPEFDLKHLKAERHISETLDNKNKDEVNSTNILSNNKDCFSSYHQGRLIAGILLTLAIPYPSLLLASPLDGIECLHRVDECKF